MESNDAILALGALAQPTRLAVFRLLVQHEPEGLPAGDIARVLDVPQNTLSTHLANLVQAELLTSERQGRMIIYRVDLDAMQRLVRYLLENCCQGETCLPDIMGSADLCAEQAASPNQSAKK